MKRIALALALVMLVGATVYAQPVPPPGLRKVEHTAAMFGDGTNATPLDLSHSCSSGQVLVWGGSSWGCGAGGITNSAGANVIPVSDGTNLIASTITDTGGTGAGLVHFSGAGTNTVGTVRIDGASAGTTKQLDIDESDLLHTAGEAINIVTRQRGTADTTAGPATYEAIDIGCSTTRAAGSNPLTNQCLLISVSGGDNNVAIEALGGAIDTNSGLNSSGGTSSIVALTVPSGVFDASGTSSASLGNHVNPFIVPGSSSVTPEIDLGLALHDGTNLEIKNTVAASSWSGIDIGGDTSVLSTVAPGVFLSRGAGGGGGVAGSNSAAIMMAGGTNSGMVGTAVNDAVIYAIAPGAAIDFGTYDGGSYDLGLKIDTSNNVIASKSLSAAAGKFSVAGASGDFTLTDPNGTGELFSTFVGANSDGGNIFIGGGGQSSVGDPSHHNWGSGHVSIGLYALASLTTGNDDTAIGGAAEEYLTTGGDDTAIGRSAMQGTPGIPIVGHRNTALGVNVLGFLVSGDDNTCAGVDSCENSDDASNNVAMGSETLAANVHGVTNLAIGMNAGQALTSSNNTILGGNGGRDLVSGDLNTFVGRGTGGGVTTGRANLLIGGNIAGLPSSLSNTTIIADGDTNFRLEIGSSGQFYKFGSAPTLTSCGTGSSIVGNDNAFRFHEGTSGASACEVDFHASWTTNPPICVAWDETDSEVPSATIAVDKIVFTTGITDGDYVNVQCVGYL